jgi:sRNA-binding regulator protein Hfq
MCADRNRLAPEVRGKMRSIMERFAMPLHLARQVVTSEMSMSDALLEMQRTELADRLSGEGRIDDQAAALLRRGLLSPEEAEFRRRLRDYKSSQGYLVSRLDELQGKDVVFALVGGDLARGRLTRIEQYQIFIETSDEIMALDKHDVKLMFLAIHRKHILKRVISWGDSEDHLARGALSRWGDRRDVKARALLSLMEGEGVTSWTTAEGDELRGRITGFNRFEVILETSKGAEVFLLRHAFSAMA